MHDPDRATGGASRRGGSRCRGRLAVAGLLVAALVGIARGDGGGEETFQAEVLPILERRCFPCHSHSGAIEGGLTLDSRSGWEVGGGAGPAVIPGKPEVSPLVAAIRRTGATAAMPPDEPLPAAEVERLVAWVRDGAPDPRVGDEIARAERAQRLAEGRSWWSLQPPRAVEPPPVADPAWNGDPIDRFVRAALDAAGITPAPPADPAILLRRLSLVLTGLPPSAHEDLAAAADGGLPVEACVERLLASPAFGEHFARHWMDVVRYGDTWGYEWDIAAKGSWEYRDYLVRAFNDDVGFDRMIREQIAGDLLAGGRADAAAGVDAALVGPMFFHLGEHRHGSSLDFNGIHQEMVDNKIDAFSKAFLGLTVGCARCHDHKLDPILQEDYYALAGVFMSPRWTVRDVALAAPLEASIAELRVLRDAIDVLAKRAWSRHAAALPPGAWVERLRAALEPAEGAAAPADPIGRRLARIVGAAAAADADTALPAAWREVAAEWRGVRDAREGTRTTFAAILDPDSPTWPAGWLVEGAGLRHGHVAAGTVRVATDGERAIAEILPAGWHTHALSPRLPGILRLPPPETFSRSTVSLRVAGGEWAAKLVVPQNAFLNEGNGGPVFLDPAAGPQWFAIGAVTPKNGVTRVLTEVATTDFNPNFPPRTGLAQAGGVTLPATDDGRGKRSWFSVTAAVAHDAPGAPPEDPAPLAGLLGGPEPQDAAGVRRALVGWITGVLSRLEEGKPAEGDAAVAAWLLARGLLPATAADIPGSTPLLGRYREVEGALPAPRTVTGMLEAGVTPIDYPLNVRGDVDREGPAVRRGFLTILDGDRAIGGGASSGRLELAERLAGGGDPLVARVWVNRVWSWVFGRGLVATPSDFGRLGAPPSHPELLDRLAVEFMRDGWSTKRLLRRLVSSATFRQGGKPSDRARDVDPTNRLLHHHPTRRLEAESVRDAMLALAGRLDRRAGGPPVRPFRPAEDPAKRLFSGPLDGAGRRSLYTEVSIMAPSAFLTAFNLPAPKISTGQRDVTSVPAQSLVLLNDPFVLEAADRWAERLLADGRSSPAARIDAMFRAAFARGATAEEIATWTAALEAAAPGDGAMADRAAWAGLAQAIFNTKEFLHYR